MFAYYRSICHNSAIQRILKGSISNPDPTDLVLVKVEQANKQKDIDITIGE